MVLFELVAKTCAEKMDCRLNPYASTEYLDLVKYLCVLARTCRDANAWVLEFEGGWRFLAANAHHYRMRCRRSDKETGFNKYVSPNSKYVYFERKKSTGARKSKIEYHNVRPHADDPSPESCRCLPSQIGSTKRERVRHWKITVAISLNILHENRTLLATEKNAFCQDGRDLSVLEHFQLRKEDGSWTSVRSVLPKRVLDAPEENLRRFRNEFSMCGYKRILREQEKHSRAMRPWKRDLKRHRHHTEKDSEDRLEKRGKKMKGGE